VEQFSFGGDVDAVLECALPTGKEVTLAAAVGIEVAEQPAPDRGQPQDGNARFLGGACGHAGLFATLAGVRALAGIYSTPGGLLSEESILRSAGGSGRYGLGWFRAGETAAGRSLGSQAFGHEGFVGSSVWLDPAADRVAILLAHRSNLTVEMAGSRERFHRLAAGL
jgi:CubicO group peptidase (beta-lactamase class C family)